MWLADAHSQRYLILNAARPCVAVLLQPLLQPFRPKCTNRILQMHHQNPVVQCTIRIRRTHTESCLQLQRDYLLIRISIEPPLNVVLCWHTCQCMKKCTNNISYVCESLPLPSSSTLLHRKIVDQKTKCSRKSVIRCHWNFQWADDRRGLVQTALALFKYLPVYSWSANDLLIYIYSWCQSVLTDGSWRVVKTLAKTVGSEGCL